MARWSHNNIAIVLLCPIISITVFLIVQLLSLHHVRSKIISSSTRRSGPLRLVVGAFRASRFIFQLVGAPTLQIFHTVVPKVHESHLVLAT